MVHKTLHSKQKIEHHKPYQKLILNSGFSGGYAASAPLVVPVMLLLKDINIIWYENRVGYQYMLTNTSHLCKIWQTYNTNGSKDKPTIPMGVRQTYNTNGSKDKPNIVFMRKS
jgi:hypothetical protein